MACSGCSASFTLFKKEHGCKNCGFSFCSNCLTKKLIVPKLGDNVKHSVCGKCYSILTGAAKTVPSPEQMSPPKALLRRLEESSSMAQAGLPKLSKESGNKKLSLNEKDRRLAEKLEKLKASRMPAHIPTVEDMEQRLARLKGMDPEVYVSKKPVVFMSKSNSMATDQVGELLRQAREEAYLDSRQLRNQRSLPENYASPDLNLNNDSNKLQPKSSGDENLYRRESEEFNPDDPEIARVRSMCEQATRRSEQEGRNHAAAADLHGMDSRMSDLNEVNKLLAQVCKGSTAEAERNLRELQKDKDFKKTFLDISKQKNSQRVDREQELSDEDSEKDMVGKVLNQLLEENALDQASGYNDLSRKKQNNTSKPQNNKPSVKPQNTTGKNQDPTDEDSSDDELPWCCICNEDATVRCIGCDSDLYCKRCYRECHDTLDIQDHKSVPFTVPSSWKSSKSTAV